MSLKSKLQSILVLSVAIASGMPPVSGASELSTYAGKPIRRTGITFPYLTQCQNPKILDKVNAQIDRLTRDFGCEQNCKSGYFHVTSKVTYADKDIFSIYASENYYCCGPYPTNDANVSQTYDLRTGNLVKFADLFADYEKNKSSILGVIFAMEIAKSQKPAGRSADADCDEMYALESLADSEFSYNLRKDDLQVQPNWPHVAEACSKLVSVPYAQLKKFERPDGLLARINSR